MHAIRVDEPHRLNAIEIDAPEPGPGEVLVRIGRAGICGSDMHIFHGLNPFARYPRVIGHEAMGRIAALGDGIADLRIGQRVVLDPVIACASCHACRIGRPNVCANLQVIGVHRDGGMSEFTLMPQANAIPIPDGLSDLAAAMAEPYSIAANVALIYGAGVVGLTCLQALRMLGARAIVAGIEDRWLERAAGLGAGRSLPQRGSAGHRGGGDRRLWRHSGDRRGRRSRLARASSPDRPDGSR